MSHAPRARKAVVMGLVASLAASAMVGILAVLFGEFRETELKILGTTLTLAGASLCALPCATRPGGTAPSPLARLGLAVPVATALAQIAGIWGWKLLDTEPLWKGVGTGWTLSVALAHAAFLGQARLADRFRRVGAAARGTTVTLALLLVLGIWTDSWDDDLVLRLVGALSILATVLTIVVPVLARMAPPPAASPSPAGLASHARCPACGTDVHPASGAMTCGACRTVFEIRILERGTP